ncbi:DUF6603 domain-containing protein [Streptomyces sp. NPDC046909]|uniref:DUF6603 domain-containing protein n=1 Tax=Streptomyces sp. NPDC046909 TaxID=3155617 RepID=UPI0033D2E5B5
MAGEEVYLARLGIWIAQALGDTSGLAADLDTDGIGFQLPDAIVSDPSVTGAGQALGDAGAQLREAAGELDAALTAADDDALAAGLVHLVEALYRFVNALIAMIDRIAARGAALGGPEGDAVEAFAGVMVRKAIDYAVITLLEQRLPMSLHILKFLGLVDWEVVEESGAINTPRFIRKDLRLDRIESLFTDPAAHFADAHGWGLATFDPEELLQSVLDFFPEESSAEAGRQGGDAFLVTGPARWSRDSNVSPPGILLDYSARLAHSFSERVTYSPSWGSDFTADLALEGGFVFRLRPPFQMSIEPKTGTASGAFRFVTNRNAAARGFTIVGGNDLVRLEAEDFGIGAELVVGASTTGAVRVDPGVLVELTGLTLSLGSEESDNFLASLLAEAEVRGVFDLGLSWRLSEGLKVRAAGGLEIAVPMHQSLGIATFETLYLILKIRDDGSFALETSAAVTGHLGPLTASVERMGVETVLSFSEGSDGSGAADKALGPVDLTAAFKPPSGVGLAVNAGVVKGGGFLYLDHDKGEYAGALELTFTGLFAVKAIGVIQTRMPDGSDGFSLLIIITAEFGTPIQLGFGFTLVGLGGLIGLNRTMRLDELAEGVRSGSVENIMFPRDVIANAPQIISDMKRFFPPLEGHFMIGPMAKLGWGTPTLVTASLGVIIEVPPGNIAILGVLKCTLPDEEAALLVLQVKFIGALEPTKGRLWFFASLYGSRVLFLTISGEMGLLIAWGDDPNFVLSVGGFHPRFTPPPMPFPSPQRVSISILNESFARIRVEGYFAVTSNTAQFGAAVELYFGVDAFSVDGHLGFDALFQFSPFYFVISFSASMSVKVFGAGLFSVRIRGELEGTSPWHVDGEGSISLLFWDISVPFSHTWGDSADTVLDGVPALPILVAELEKRENWIAVPPTRAPISVSLREIDPTAELVLHPVGTLRVAQRGVPLDLDIQKIGNKAVSDVSRLALTVGGTGLVERVKARESFASAQYRDIDGAAKLSAPGYEKFDAGTELSVAAGDTRTSHAVKRVVLHELIVIDDNYKQHQSRFFNAGLGWFEQRLSSNATARSPLSRHTARQQAPFTEKIKAKEGGFVIASAVDNSPWADGRSFASQAEAVDALKRHARSAPKAAADLHVIPTAEASVAV